MTIPTQSGAALRVILLDQGSVPAVLQQVADRRGMSLDVGQGHAALRAAGPGQVIAVLSGPLLQIGNALAEGVVAETALEAWRAQAAPDVAALAGSAAQVVMLERAALARTPAAAMASVFEDGDVPPDLVPDQTDVPASLFLVLAAALVAACPDARDLAARVTAACGAAASVDPDTAAEACRDAAALHDAATHARSEALVARAGRAAAERQVDSLRSHAARREAVLAAALLDAPDAD